MHQIFAWVLTVSQKVVARLLDKLSLGFAHPDQKPDVPFGEHELCIYSHVVF
jgi:hypothetical protein